MTIKLKQVGTFASLYIHIPNIKQKNDASDKQSYFVANKKPLVKNQWCG